MIQDRFDKDYNIVIAELTGQVTMDEILKWFDTITPERFPVSQLKMLSDASNVEYVFRKNELIASDKAMEVLTGRFKSVKIAVIHSKPKETAYSEMVRLKTRHKNYTQKTFFTLESALEWLLRG